MTGATERPAEFDALLARLEVELEIMPDKPDETPGTTLLCLWALAEGHELAVSQVQNYVPRPLPEKRLELLESFIQQRLSGVPLSYLTGRQDFMGEVFLSSPASFVPRRETEPLVRAAISRLRSLSVAEPLVIDVCTGGGSIALTIARELPKARVFGADLSPEAVELACRNACLLSRERVEFRCGDLLAPFETDEFLGQVDLITCNPPYMSSGRVDRLPAELRCHEPRLGFDGGPFGISVISRLFSTAPILLRSGGWIALEVGHGQGAGVIRRLAREAHWDEVIPHTDAHGEIRAIEARYAA